MPPTPPPEKLRQYWRRTLLLTGGLLLAWFLATFAVGFFASELSFDFFGWPFAFWVGAQGAPILYVLLIWFHARRMERLDREFGLEEEADQ